MDAKEAPTMADTVEEKQDPSHLLHLAVIDNNLEVARFLLKHGVCPNGRATVKQLCVDFPTDDEHRRHLRWRLGACAEGAIAEALDGKSCSALHLAARSSEPELAELLLQHGAEVNSPMDGGETPLLVAVLSRSLVVAELLLGHGADVNARTAWGKSIVHYAARAGHTEALELLLARGGHVNAPEPEGLTALHIAAEAGNKEMLEMLLSRGADVGVKAKNGATALHYAAIRGHLEVVEAMVNFGADIALIMKHGGVDLTPFSKITVAEERKTMEIVAKYNTKTRLKSWYNTVVSKFKSGSKDRRHLFCAEAE